MTTLAPPSARTAPLAPRVRQPARKGKKQWRRNVDLTLEEQALDERRELERLGLGDLTQLDDTQLFTTDTRGDDNVRKREFNNKKLRIDEILEARSGIPALTSRPRAPPPAKDPRTLSAGEHAKIQRRVLSKKRASTDADPATANKKQRAASDVDDLWAAADEQPTADNSETADFLPPSPKIKVPATLRMHPKAKMVVPAVTVAPPGASYNPAFEDHQVLLREAIAEEERRIAELEQLNALIPNKRAVTQGAAITEADLATDTSSEEPSDDEAEQEHDAPVPMVPRRLTRAERNRQKRRKLEEARAEHKRREREIAERMRMLNELQHELAVLEQQRLEKVEQRRQRREERLTRPLRLSGHAFAPVPKALEVQLTEDVSGSLRGLKPEGSLLKDRFLAMQRRNMIEPRVPVTHKRKYPLKEYEKRDYREFE